MKEGFKLNEEGINKTEGTKSSEEKKILKLTQIMDNLRPNFYSYEAGENLAMIEELDDKLRLNGSNLLNYELSKSLFGGQYIQPKYIAFDTKDNEIEKMINFFAEQHKKYVEKEEQSSKEKIAV